MKDAVRNVAIVGGLFLTLMGNALAGGELRVVSVEPAARAIGASVHSPVVVRFDRPVDRSSITDGGQLWAFARWSGTVSGTYAFLDGDRVVTLTPDHPFSAGESVMVFLSHHIEGADGSTLRAAGYSYQFWTRAQPASMTFTEIGRMSTRSGKFDPTQAYGGIASDLDGDGYLDITIINEITEDLRVFLNRADQSGTFLPFIAPTFPVGDRASPSEPSDFNRDGIVDICVANIDDDSVSILLGNGDGTFAPQQKISVGDAPRGIAVLDADGDGDVDIVNTNASSPSRNMSLLLNDGTGVFGPPTFFPAGGAGAWALAAGDMDEDGILDLVIGAQSSQRIIVRRGTGKGTFLPVSSQLAGGAVWMIVLGDIDGDGHEDVAGVNSGESSGAILIGDGQGSLGPPLSYPTDPFPLATDLGDLDGDGDLEWITSSFFGDWWLYVNDGRGGYTLQQTFPAASASSCSLMLDFDNDGDVDLGLIDEIADEVVLMRNDGLESPVAPPTVPDGTAGTSPLRVARLDPGATTLSVTWDAMTCPGTDWHIVHGTGSSLPANPGDAYGVAGGRCGVGLTQPLGWLTSPDPAATPSNLIWFVMTSGDTAGTEGSWGVDSQGTERAGPGSNGASGVCGITDKNPGVACVP